ncbi:MAG: hypothetical protein ACYC0X_10205 [Pirellulaceae bacterium]
MSRHHDLRPVRRLHARFSVHSKRQRNRNLQIENLESRVVLSGLPEAEGSTCEPAVAAVPPAVELNDPATIISMSAIPAPLPAPEAPQPVSAAPEVPLAETCSDVQAADTIFTQSDTSYIGAMFASAYPTTTYPTTSYPTTSYPTMSDPTTSTTDVLLDPVGMLPPPLPPPPPPLPPPPEDGGTPTPTPDPLLPPSIINFEGENQLGYWVFRGNVTDDKNPAGLKVYFGGLLAGRTTVVDQFSFFEILVSLGVGTVGYVTAYTIDGDGLKSNVVSYRIV